MSNTAVNNTMEIEDSGLIPFFERHPVSIVRGKGVRVIDEDEKVYYDFTAGWGVTCLGHCHPVMVEALNRQAGLLWQSPNAGLSYSPSRARLLSELIPTLPGRLTNVFFTNSGTESNDASLKLARKITGRARVITTTQSFHGRTHNAYSVTGGGEKNRRFGVSEGFVDFVPFNDIEALKKVLDDSVAAVILEPIQGEGGVNIPDNDYLPEVSRLCAANDTLLIIDEIQTGFCRTGKFFATTGLDIQIDFMTMAKGLGGGFPIGAFAVSPRVASMIELGDHGGTYCGNPLGCAVAASVVQFLKENGIDAHVREMGERASQLLGAARASASVVDVRGRGLLWAIEFVSQELASNAVNSCRERGLLVTQTQKKMIRLFPALTISESELVAGIDILLGTVAEI